MPVRNPARKGPRREVVNQEPTTARGRRRSQNTEEYQENCRTRNQQSYPVAPGKSNTFGPGPFKGPSKCSSRQEFKDFMAGKR